MEKTMQEQLASPFVEADIEWRLQWKDEAKNQGLAVPYVTNRAIQYRLDQVAGVDKWKNEFIPWHNDREKASQICGISIYFAERQEWVTKYDGAEDSDIESIKGGLSDSMKRAAVQWGIGRYLYGMDAVFVGTEKKGRNTIIAKSEQSKLDKAHREHVARFFKTKPEAAPEKQPKPEKQLKPAAAPQPSSQKPVLAPPSVPADGPPPITDGVFQVMQVAPQSTLKGGKNTHMQLKCYDGQIIQAYLKGENPAIKPGVLILDAKISEKVKGGVRFLILDEFRLAEQSAA